jgi:hypothetical protein
MTLLVAVAVAQPVTYTITGATLSDGGTVSGTVTGRGMYVANTFVRIAMAEREGFEPSIEFPLYTLSKRAPSTTRPSLRGQQER